jgi:hypothetical protein
MNIPNHFKSAIKTQFYDKEVSLYSVDTSVEEDGFQRKGEPSVLTGSFLGNVNFNNLEQIRETYGIDEEIDLSITTDTEVDLDQVIGYLGRFYTVIKAIPYDSHYLLIAKKCSLKSSTSISA